MLIWVTAARGHRQLRARPPRPLQRAGVRLYLLHRRRRLFRLCHASGELAAAERIDTLGLDRRVDRAREGERDDEASRRHRP